MKALQTYGGKSIEKALTFLNKDEDHTKEELHKFRLSIKRLKFIARLLILLDLDNKHVKALIDEVKPVFKSAGSIREYQLFQQIVANVASSESPITGLLLEEMKNEVAWAEIVFQKNMLGTDQKVFKRFGDQLIKVNKHFPPDKISKRIQKVVKKRMYKWPVSHEQLMTSDWHSLRREMKWVLAVLPLMKDSDQFSRPLHDIIKHTTELVGEWHDLITCRTWCVDNIPVKHFTPEEVKEWIIPLEKAVALRATHFEKAYGVLTEQLEYNEFLSGKKKND